MTLPWRTPCETHRSALHDFVDRRAGYDPGARDVASALDHLERCPDCERELAATAMVISALRRLADDVGTAEPSPDAWQHLVGRLERRKPRRLFLTSPLAGLALSAGLVVAMIAPQLGLEIVQSSPESTVGPRPATPEAIVEEQRWLRDRQVTGARSSTAVPATPVDLTPSRARDRLGPDGVHLAPFTPRSDAPQGRQY
jgi:anti-sigma factor RsiW